MSASQQVQRSGKRSATLQQNEPAEKFSRFELSTDTFRNLGITFSKPENFDQQVEVITDKLFERAKYEMKKANRKSVKDRSSRGLFTGGDEKLQVYDAIKAPIKQIFMALAGVEQFDLTVPNQPFVYDSSDDESDSDDDRSDDCDDCDGCFRCDESDDCDCDGCYRCNGESDFEGDEIDSVEPVNGVISWCKVHETTCCRGSKSVCSKSCAKNLVIYPGTEAGKEAVLALIKARLPFEDFTEKNKAYEQVCRDRHEKRQAETQASTAPSKEDDNEKVKSKNGVIIWCSFHKTTYCRGTTCALDRIVFPGSKTGKAAVYELIKARNAAADQRMLEYNAKYFC